MFYKPPSAASVHNPLKKHLDKLGKALESGDVPAAKTAFETIKNINKKATVRLAGTVVSSNTLKTQRICRFE